MNPAQEAACFNSTMVRLKAAPVETPVVLQARFNSTMVRLKEQDATKDAIAARVSIPQWFD